MSFISKGISRIFLAPILLLLVIVSGGVAVYSWSLYQKSQDEVRQLKNPQEIAKKEISKITAAAGKLVVLPEGEDPTIATVMDADKLKDQPFFARAENGDKLLIYTQAKRAVLYRPSIDKVIDVAPVNIGSAQAQNVKVVLYNGSGQPGITNPVESQLKQEIKNIEVVEKNNAAKSDYQGMIVVDLTGNNTNAASQMAQVLGAQVEALPEGETRPNADLLVIVGQTSAAPSPTSAP